MSNRALQYYKITKIVQFKQSSFDDSNKSGKNIFRPRECYRLGRRVPFHGEFPKKTQELSHIDTWLAHNIRWNVTGFRDNCIVSMCGKWTSELAMTNCGYIWESSRSHLELRLRLCFIFLESKIKIIFWFKKFGVFAVRLYSHQVFSSVPNMWRAFFSLRG